MNERPTLTSEVWSKGGVEYLRLCLAATVHWRLSELPDGRGIFAAAAVGAGLVEAVAQVFQTEEMKAPEARGGFTVAALVQSRLAPGPSPYRYLAVSDAHHPDEAPSHRFELAIAQHRDAGYVVVQVPVSADAHGKIAKALRSIAEALPMVHGYAGYSLSYNRFGDLASCAELEFARIGARHPGVDLPSPSTTSFVEEAGLRCANWLTLLGPELKRRLPPAWRQDLGTEIVVDPVGEGILIRAGDTPCLGDVNRGVRCDSYRSVGRALRALRMASHPAFILGSDGVLACSERTDAWLARFDS